MKIIVIDPCYVTGDKDWEAMCEQADWEDKTLDDAFDVILLPRSVKGAWRDEDHKKHEKGQVIIHALQGTANGDGSYGNFIGVDSGTLSVCEVSDELYEQHKQFCEVFDTIESATRRMEYVASQI